MARTRITSALAALALATGLAAVAAPGEAEARACPAKIVVGHGDTLSGIAAACHTTIWAILRANPQITHPSYIYAGEVIRVPAPRYGYTPRRSYTYGHGRGSYYGRGYGAPRYGYAKPRHGYGSSYGYGKPRSYTRVYGKPRVRYGHTVTTYRPDLSDRGYGY